MSAAFRFSIRASQKTAHLQWNFRLDFSINSPEQSANQWRHWHLVPTYALKRLVNHSVSNDMTGRYLVLDIERLRTYMTQISEAFIELLGVDDVLVKEWKTDDTSETSSTVQLKLDFGDEHIL